MCICWCVTYINYKMHGATLKMCSFSFNFPGYSGSFCLLIREYLYCMFLLISPPTIVCIYIVYLLKSRISSVQIKRAAEVLINQRRGDFIPLDN